MSKAHELGVISTGFPLTSKLVAGMTVKVSGNDGREAGMTKENTGMTVKVSRSDKRGRGNIVLAGFPNWHPNKPEWSHSATSKAEAFGFFSAGMSLKRRRSPDGSTST